MAKILISLSILFLTLSAVFGVLNTSKTRELRELAQRSSSSVAPAVESDQTRQARDKELRAREAALAAANAKFAQTETKVASAEAELVKSQSEKAELQAKLQANQQQIAELQKRLDEAGSKELMPDPLPMPGAGDLETQLEDTRRQLDTAERERQLLNEKITSPARREAVSEPPKPRVTKRRPEVRGTVLAVNQAYNFVVLNLGGRQGVEANADMLVLRNGTLIGKIRVSSVEPATAIGDIISNTLARGVQVQPGDVVIYAGSNP